MSQVNTDYQTYASTAASNPASSSGSSSTSGFDAFLAQFLAAAEQYGTSSDGALTSVQGSVERNTETPDSVSMAQLRSNESLVAAFMAMNLATALMANALGATRAIDSQQVAAAEPGTVQFWDDNMQAWMEDPTEHRVNSDGHLEYFWDGQWYPDHSTHRVLSTDLSGAILTAQQVVDAGAGNVEVRDPISGEWFSDSAQHRVNDGGQLEVYLNGTWNADTAEHRLSSSASSGTGDGYLSAAQVVAAGTGGVEVYSDYGAWVTDPFDHRLASDGSLEVFFEGEWLPDTGSHRLPGDTTSASASNPSAADGHILSATEVASAPSGSFEVYVGEEGEDDWRSDMFQHRLASDGTLQVFFEGEWLGDTGQHRYL